MILLKTISQKSAYFTEHNTAFIETILNLLWCPTNFKTFCFHKLWKGNVTSAHGHGAPGSADSCMMHTQCGWLGAESFINKYDSDHFMSTVKVMAFSILETYTTTSHMWTWLLKSTVWSSSHSSLLTGISLFIFLTILDDNLFLILSYFLLVLYQHIRLLIYCV